MEKINQHISIVNKPVFYCKIRIFIFTLLIMSIGVGHVVPSEDKKDTSYPEVKS